MLFSAVLMLFELEDKKMLYEEGKSQWSALRGFNWQHFKSYIIPQPTDLFRHTILLAKFNILTTFPCKYWGSIYSHMIFQWSKGIVAPPKKTWSDLFINTFHGRWGTIFFFWWAVLHGGLMIRSCQGWGSFTNAFSSNLKTI